MNHTPPEPQDITTALLSLDIISEVYRRQLEWRDIYAKDLKRGEVIMLEDLIAEHGIFYWITIIAPFKITDFSSLNKCIIDKGTIQPEIRNTIKRILAVAKENIHLFETMESIPVDKLILAYFNVDSQNNVTRLLGKLATEASNNPYKQVFNNYQLDEYCNEVADFMSSCLAPDQKPYEKPDKTHDQIALIHVYDDKPITRDNAAEIAKGYKHYAKNSGEKIYQRYTYYTPTDRRKGEPESPTAKKMKNKIKLFESVLPYLSDKGKQLAKVDIDTLKASLKKEYQ